VPFSASKFWRYWVTS